MPRFKGEIRYDVSHVFAFVIDAENEQEALQEAHTAMKAGAFVGADFEACEESGTEWEVNNMEEADDDEEFIDWDCLRDGELIKWTYGAKSASVKKGG